MEKQVKDTLNNILKNNKTWPIILEGGISESDFLNATFLSATIPSESLAVINDLNGPVLPEWVKQIEEKGDSKTNLLVITDLDKIEMRDQIKFKSLLELRQLSGYKLPENLQILILIDSGNRDKVDNQILSLSLYYKI